MPYVTGTANNQAELLSAIQGACTAHGWTLSGSVLHAGDCHIQLTAGTNSIKVSAGTGIDGSNALTGQAPASAYLGSPYTPEPLSYPCTYNIHVFAAEVFVLVRFGIDAWVWAAWGQSPVQGLPGTGVWFTASTTRDQGYNQLSWWASPPYFGRCYNYSLLQGTGPFWIGELTALGTQSFVHHGLDGGSWTTAMDASGNQYAGTAARAMSGAGYLMAAYQPNLWNGEAALVPIQPYITRGSNKVSIIADLANARYVRLDNLNVEDTITLGTDVWKVYPFYRRDSANRNGIASSSGTLGWAVRYDG